MDSFFNDCLYAWDFKDSLVGEIGGIGWDNGTLMSSTDATYARAGNCWMRSSSTNTTTSFLDLSDDIISINFWQYPSDFNVNYLIKLIDSNNKFLEVSLASSYVYAGYTNTGGTTTTNRSSSTITSINSIRLYTIIIDKTTNTLKLRYNAFNNTSGNFSSEYTVDISGRDVDFSSVKLQIHSAYYSYNYNLMRIWPKELTETDIQYLYNSNIGRLLTMPDAKSIYEDCYAYYKLDETSGTTVNDSTSNNRHGTIYGTNAANLTNSGGIIESCYKAMTTLDNGKYIMAGFNSSVFSGLTEATISCWIKPEQYSSNPSTAYVLGGVCCGSLNYNNYNLVLRTERDMYAQYVKCVANIHTINGTYTITAGLTGGAWNHIVLVFKDDMATIYVNGAYTNAYSTSGALYNSTQPVTIMTNPTGNVISFLGEIDEIGFWQRGLSQLEVQTLYNGGSGLPFESGPTYLVELTDGVGVTDDVEAKASYKVDLQDIAYTTDSEDTKWDATVSFKDTVHVTDNVKVKMNYKVNLKDEVKTEDNQRIIIYKNGIDSIWTDREKPDNTMWTNRPKPWISK